MKRFSKQGMLVLGLLTAGFSCWSLGQDIREAEERRALADGLFRRNLHALAIAEYAALLREYPEVPEQDIIFFQMGESLRREGRLVQAEQAFQQVVRRFPDSPVHASAAFKRASLFLDLEQYEGAVELFEALLLDDPPAEWREASLYALAEALNRVGRVQDSMARITLLLEAFPEGDYADFARVLKGGMLARGEPESRLAALALFARLAEDARNPRIAAEARFQQARLLEEAGDQDAEAATAYLRLLEDHPEDVRAREAKLPAAWAAYRAERFADALRLATELGRLDDLDDQERIRGLYLKANCERQLMQSAAALASYTRLLELDLDPELSETVRYEKALTLYRQGDFVAALAEAERVAPAAPERAQDLLWLQAEAAAALPDPHRAVQFYRLLLTRHPESPLAADTLYRLGYHLQQQENWIEASRYYLRLAEQFPDHSLTPRALFASGLVQARAGQSDAALRDWGRLLAQHPDHETIPEALFQKAMEQMRQVGPREALATLDRLLRQAPEGVRKVEAHFWRGVLLHELEDWTEALTALQAALAQKPDTTIEREARFVLGMTLQRLNREAEAADLFQPLLEASIREKFSPDRLAWLSEFQFERGAFEAAADAARSLLQVSDAAIWSETRATLLGRALRAQDLSDAAAEAFRAALAVGVGSRFAAEAALRLGELELDAGRIPEAEVLLVRAARLARDPDAIGLRAAAYAALARAAFAREDYSTSIRYNLSIGLLFDDPHWVPQALSDAAEQLLRMNRRADATATARELIERYPHSQAAAEWTARLAEPDDLPVPEDATTL